MKAAIMGFGTIGSGVWEALLYNKERIAAKAGEAIEVKYVLDLREFPGQPVQEVLVHDVNVILDDPEVAIVVETMGGTKPAYQFVKGALEHGKSVCTSNKELVAAYGAELIALAKEKGVSFLFEASVGGGIPIIRPINEFLCADEITEINGILNGTTNYILTRMDEDGAEFDSTLAEAQRLGYAERNPSADIEGYDACRKIAILTSLACGKQVDYQDIHTEGITNISSVDFRYAKKMGMNIRLLGRSVMKNGKVSAITAPYLVGSDCPLYGVKDVFNGIMVKGTVSDTLMFYGRGAGKLPTASAVVADMLDAARHPAGSVKIEWSQEKQPLTAAGDLVSTFFVRAEDKDGEAASHAASIFGVINPVDAGIEGEVAFVTAPMCEAEFKEKAAAFPEMKSCIRIYS